MIIRSTLLFVTMAALSGYSPAFGQSSGCRSIEGAWQVSIKMHNPPPGAVDFDSLITFVGSVTIEHNGAPGSGPAIGEWSCDGGNSFRALWLKYIFNPQSGALVGLVKIRGKLKVLSNREYSSEDIVEFYLPNGQLAASWNATETGKRIVAE